MTAFFDEKGREVTVRAMFPEHDAAPFFCSVRTVKGGLHKRVRYIAGAHTREQALVNLRKYGEGAGWKRKI